MEGLELGGDLLQPQAGPQADIDVLDVGRSQQRVHQLIGRHVLAQDERSLLEAACQVVDDREIDERTAVTDEALVLELHGDRLGRVALLDQELDLGGLRRDRLGQRGAQVLGDDVLDEGQLERGRVVLRDRHDRVADDRPEDRQGDRQHDRGEDEREDEELQEPDQPVPATATVPATARARDRLRVLGDRFGRVGVGIVRPRIRGPAVPRASAGADRHRLLSWGSWGRGMDERAPARVSSSS